MFIVGCATGGVAAQLVVPPVRAGTAPTRWEYQCPVVDKAVVTSTVNRLGAEGWELVSTARTGWREEIISCAKRALP
ncbi:MAG TPA: hypothetical protein VHT91_10075 [Kofleriaceae bacterium]|jgi:hypothetical protein|nr:hypothetical protein [Kofleriaceae bacterium]